MIIAALLVFVKLLLIISKKALVSFARQENKTSAVAACFGVRCQRGIFSFAVFQIKLFVYNEKTVKCASVSAKLQFGSDFGPGKLAESGLAARKAESGALLW